MDLVTVFNDDYFSYGKNLIKSYKKYNNGKIFVYGVNLSEDQKKSLEEYNCISFYEDVDLENYEGIARKNDGGLIRTKYWAKVRYLCSKRHFFVRDILKEYKNSILMLDADSLVLKSLDGLDEFQKKYDISLYFRGHNKKVKKLHGGIIIAKSTEKTLLFYDSLCNKINYVGSDQISLFDSFLELEEEVSFGDIKNVTSINRRNIKKDFNNKEKYFLTARRKGRDVLEKLGDSV